MLFIIRIIGKNTLNQFFKNQNRFLFNRHLILNGAKIGKNCIIGANALITENKIIPDNSLVVGSPGKIVRQVSTEETKSITENAIHYQDNWKKYSKSVF